MKKHIILVFFTIIISLTEFSGILVYSIDNTTMNLLNQSETVSNKAYLSIYELEKKGGDINGLVNRLDDVLNLHHEGLKHVQIEEYDKAILLFRESITLSNEIIQISIRLSVITVNIKTKVQRNKIITNTIASLIIIIIGFISWKIFKNKYMDV